MRKIITEEQIANKIENLQKLIKNQKYDYVICVLNGAYMFFSDLTKGLDVNVDFVKVSSYVDTKSTGELDIQYANFGKYRGLKVLIVDDICDSGYTLKSIKEYILQAGAELADTCVLLNKKEAHSAENEPTFYAFLIENEFVIGYGLDYNDKYRTLPYIAVLGV